VCHSKPNTNDRITVLPDLSLSKHTTHSLQIHTHSLLIFCESSAQILQFHVDSAFCLNFVVKWLLTFGSPHIFKSLLFHCITVRKFTLLLSICVFYESPVQNTVISCRLCSLTQFCGEVASGLCKSSHFLVVIVSTIVQSAKSYSAHYLSLVFMNHQHKILRIHVDSVLCLKSLLREVP